jgi:deoxyribonuclease-4
VDGMLAEFDRRMGLHRLRMVHLNDSRSKLGSREDRHEHIGAGRIGVAGLRRILVHPALDHVTYYLETPGMEDGWDAVNVARVHALVEGRSLDPLPPEAFDVRSAKGRSAPAESGDDPATGGR